ncbi:MAG: hypothetical protein U0441_07720 [Polyangiaceae bacterium]
MKNNGVVTRILKTSSATGATSAKARPIAPVVPPAQKKGRDADDIMTGLGDMGHATPTPVFVQNMEREIEEILSGKGTKLSFEATRAAAGTPTPLVPAPSEVVTSKPEAPERETVPAPGGRRDSQAMEAHVHVPPPPRPPPLPAEMREAATTHEVVTQREGRGSNLPHPPAPTMPRRADLVPVKTQMEPVRVQVKPPPLPLPLGPRGTGDHAIPETRREPGARNRPEPPVEFWTDTSLVESIPPSDPNSVLPARAKSPSAEYAQAIVLYGTAHEPPPRRVTPPALPAPQAKPPEAPAARPSPPPTAWVQKPAAPPVKPMRARLQAAALGIAAGVAISMVLTWRPPTLGSTSAPAAEPSANVAVMAPEKASSKQDPASATASPAQSTQPVIQPAQAAIKLTGKLPPKAAQPEAKPQPTAAPKPIHGSQPNAQGAAAPATPKAASSGRIAGDEE